MPSRVFADTFYWIALINPHDADHARVTAHARAQPALNMVTTDEVLVEFLAGMSGLGPYWRGQAVLAVRDVLAAAAVAVIAADRAGSSTPSTCTKPGPIKGTR
jgi:hypothetical protein